jgi:hypothetical protein
MSLARASDDPTHKQHYEDLALEFAQSAAGRGTFDSTIPHFTPVKRTPDSSNTSPQK